MNILPKNQHKPSVELVEDVKKSEGSKALIITKSQVQNQQSGQKIQSQKQIDQQQKQVEPPQKQQEDPDKTSQKKLSIQEKLKQLKLKAAQQEAPKQDQIEQNADQKNVQKEQGQQIKGQTQPVKQILIQSTTDKQPDSSQKITQKKLPDPKSVQKQQETTQQNQTLSEKKIIIKDQGQQNNLKNVISGVAKDNQKQVQKPTQEKKTLNIISKSEDQKQNKALQKSPMPKVSDQQEKISQEPQAQQQQSNKKTGPVNNLPKKADNEIDKPQTKNNEQQVQQQVQKQVQKQVQQQVQKQVQQLEQQQEIIDNKEKQIEKKIEKQIDKQIEKQIEKELISKSPTLTVEEKIIQQQQSNESQMEIEIEKDVQPSNQQMIIENQQNPNFAQPQEEQNNKIPQKQTTAVEITQVEPNLYISEEINIQPPQQSQQVPINLEQPITIPQETDQKVIPTLNNEIIQEEIQDSKLRGQIRGTNIKELNQLILKYSQTQNKKKIKTFKQNIKKVKLIIKTLPEVEQQLNVYDRFRDVCKFYDTLNIL